LCYATFALPGNGGDWLINEIGTAYPAVAVVLATMWPVISSSVQ
jgi:hypothetical protein